MSDRPYHHGNLPREVLDNALSLTEEFGPTGWSLRRLARRAGVSHTAVAHHFGDKTGVLTALATEGFRMQTERLAAVYEGTGNFLEMGVAYVRFAVEHSAHFTVMYRPELHHRDEPDLVAAKKEASAVLYPPASLAAGMGRADRTPGLAAWSLVHGLATLWLNDALPPDLGNDVDDVTRSIARHLFIRV
ncbi:MAG TPA: TetR/AcrR family transcriptional regulator [Acidimicrobiia bacterium]|nr:TetR/AcrR family transcriptional regulator [Acidimicrobiia bacterium]